MAANEVAEELSGEDPTVDGFASVDSDEPADEMEPRVELDEPPLREDEDEEGPTGAVEAQAARDEASAESLREPGPDEVEVRHIPAAAHDDEDAHEEVTTLGGGSGESDEPVRAFRPRSEEEGEPVEVIGGDAMDETPRRNSRPRRHYKIQEVIKRRQVLLVQVVKEERGNKGAALTTYLSLAGRYSVLMPNTARGGGISRKITNTQDRSRLKAIAEELDVPEGMGVILRTAGASRTKPEVKRDFEYLLRMWETVRETTLASTAPMLVYEEGSLIKRAIRDLYSKEIDEIVVAGEEGYKEAKDFMRLLMPNNTRAVVPLSRPAAGVRQDRSRGAARRDVLQPGDAALGRLHRHQPDRGAGRDRRQLGPLDARAQYRGHGASAPIWRRPTRSPGSCGCAILPA